MKQAMMLRTEWLQESIGNVNFFSGAWAQGRSIKVSLISRYAQSAKSMSQMNTEG
jgi:hypothetical protein